MLALIILIPGHCFDFTKYISQNGNLTCPEWRRPTVARWRSVKKKRGKSIMKLLKFELMYARGNLSWRSSQLINTGFITKAISRMCSDKTDRPQQLSSICFILLVFGKHAQSRCLTSSATLYPERVQLTGRRANWQYVHRQRGALNGGFELF